jgi:hypothetical protein
MIRSWDKLLITEHPALCEDLAKPKCARQLTLLMHLKTIGYCDLP